MSCHVTEHDIMAGQEMDRTTRAIRSRLLAMFVLTQEYKRRLGESEGKFQGAYLAVNKANEEIAQLKLTLANKPVPKRKRRKHGVRTRAVIRKMKAERAAL